MPWITTFLSSGGLISENHICSITNLKLSIFVVESITSFHISLIGSFFITKLPVKSERQKQILLIYLFIVYYPLSVQWMLLYPKRPINPFKPVKFSKADNRHFREKLKNVLVRKPGRKSYYFSPILAKISSSRISYYFQLLKLVVVEFPTIFSFWN